MTLPLWSWRCRAIRKRVSRRHRRELRNCGSGRMRRRPATAARPHPPARNSPHRAPRRQRPCRACRIISTGRLAVERLWQIHPPPRRSDRPSRCAGKNGAERRDAARLGNAAGNPVDRVEGSQRLCRRIGIGGFRVVDEGHIARAGRFPACGAQGPESSSCRASDLGNAQAQAPAPRHRPCRHSANCARP